MPWTDDAGTQHPVSSDEPTTEGMRHIQACPYCRATFPEWLPMLDVAAWLERGDDGHPEA
jgi:hypothetical protein